jgi:hypothetical protein
MGDLQTVGIGHSKAWRQAWPWGGSLVGGGGGWPHRCSGYTDLRRESREKREQRANEKREQREERANEKKREKFSEEMRGERKKSEEISVDMVGSELKKLVF